MDKLGKILNTQFTNQQLQRQLSQLYLQHSWVPTNKNFNKRGGKKACKAGILNAIDVLRFYI